MSAEDRAAQLREIARLVKELPCGAYPDVCLGCRNRAGVEMLRGVGGDLRAQVNAKFGVIESSEVVVDGVLFKAQWDRPATREELALLESTAAFRVESLIVPLVRP